MKERIRLSLPEDELSDGVDRHDEHTFCGLCRAEITCGTGVTIPSRRHRLHITRSLS